MTIDKQAIHHIAALAELAVTDGEAVALASQLERIVGMVAQLQEADVPAEAQEYVAGPDRVTLRDDVVAPEKLHRTPEMLTTGFQHGLYVVPRLGSQEHAE
ncbi:MAG TPA: Asp-tRNA(Asn)/Glu-tRNA(Gln) amidotransferase subunit GatC [Gemmatimonadales bacterium]|nr:Asp-tRNA(Asn)/Glu-tRNA(Gln) amidotransferase subunit GatC [Gemmatimonadales bacterium]